MKEIAVNCGCASNGEITVHGVVVVEIPRKLFEANIKVGNQEIRH